ncbi:hypothetical protein E1301_Tti024321 [Triplophysa tibetana]|uniref:Uncharacterized protein n=1 Tax=Triplophysa tibetana TaxID=1572043 RepID=A0A5A9MWN4_9TELE|nr:hypothetical protein E1301_Tti024321 [Triplophysa tibetana]
MLKRTKTEVEGYLHDVSPVKEAAERKSKYFTASLQEATKNSRVVIFDVQRHHLFTSAQNDRTPVKLTDVVFSPSRQKKGETDILVNQGTSFTCARKLDFAFDLCSETIILHQTLQSILHEPREYQRVNITVKLLCLTEQTESMTRRFKKMERRCYDVADETGGISLTVWGPEALTVGKWYKVTNTSVRLFGSCFCLSTSPESHITMVPDVADEVAQIVSNYKTTQGEVVTADVNIEYLCPKQHSLTSVNASTLMTRCQQCSAFCRTSKISSVYRAKVSLQDKCGTITTFMIEDIVLRTLLNVPKGTTVETDTLVGKLFADENSLLQVKYRGQRVMSAEFVALECETTHEPSTSTTPTTTAAREVTDDMSDTLMLEELFEEDTKERASDPQNEQALKQGEQKINKATLFTKGTIAASKQPQKSLSADNAINHRSDADKTKTSAGSDKTSSVSAEPSAKHLKKTQGNNNVKANKKNP